MSRPSLFRRKSFLQAASAILAFTLFALLLALIACGGVTKAAPGPPSGTATGGTPGGNGGGTGGGSGGSGGSGGGGGNTGGPTGRTPGTGSTFVYVVDAGPNQIETYKMDPTSGALTSAGAPLMVGHGLGVLAVSPNGKFGYDIANDFVNNTFQNVLLAFSLNTTSGLPTLIQTIQLGGGSGGSATVDPTSRFVFVSEDSNNTTGSGIAVFNIQSDGTLIQNGPLMPTDVNPGHIAVDPKDRFLYTDTSATNKIWGFTINATTGTLTPAPSTPFTLQRSIPQAGKEPTDLNEVLDPTGQRLFVVDNINSRVNVFTIDQGTGAIALQGATTSPQFEELFAPALDPKGRFLYIAEFNANAITGFVVGDTTTPNFLVIPGMPVTTSGAPNRWMVVDPTSTFVYSVEVDAIGDLGKLDGYQIDQTSGTLIRLVSTPITLKGSPVWIAIGP
jgi:6-phosphogluconolactonase